jgi:hypothetical protein
MNLLAGVQHCHVRQVAIAFSTGQKIELWQRLRRENPKALCSNDSTHHTHRPGPPAADRS